MRKIPKLRILLVSLVMMAAAVLPACVRVESTPLCILFSMTWAAMPQGETVTFTNETTGGKHPYTKAEWDFNGDGVFDLTLTGNEAEVIESFGYTYNKAGIYTVRLQMTDSTPATCYWEMSNVVAKTDRPPIVHWGDKILTFEQQSIDWGKVFPRLEL